MSEFQIHVVHVGAVTKHPNADSLSITSPAGTAYPVIIRTGEFVEGDLAVYVPVDSVVPADDPRWAFLGEHRRIRAKRLRGTFSMGLFTKPDPAWVLGQDVREIMRIEKYEPPEPLSMGGENERCPFEFPHYTDIEGLRKFPNVLVNGELVVITEKIHGANGRAIYHDGRLWVGSHGCVKRPDPNNMWWKAAAKYGLEEKLKTCPDTVVFFEVYGQVQDLKYGVPQSEAIRIVAFDAMDWKTREYLPHRIASALFMTLDIPEAPLLYEGPWLPPDISVFAEGASVLDPTQPVREGYVVRPAVERFSEAMSGRCILKMIGEGYMTRKEKR